MAGTDDALENLASDLTRQGYELVENCEFDEALVVAEKLQDIRFTSGFEIAALALNGKGDLEGAVRILELGVAEAPNIWLNWQLLGNYLSDLSRYEAAASAYEQAMACSDADVSSIRLNQAILAQRRERPNDALQLLEQVTDASLAARGALVETRSLRDLGRLEEAFDVATRALDLMADNLEEFEAEIFAHLTALSGRIMLETGEPPDGVRDLLISTLALASNDRAILKIIREIDDSISPASTYFRILLHCSVPIAAQNMDEPVGCFIDADVIANSAEEAAFLVMRLKPDLTRHVCEIDEIEVLEDRPTGLKGVYRIKRCDYLNEADDTVDTQES